MSNQTMAPPAARATNFRVFTPQDADRVSEIIFRCLREVNSKDYPLDEIERMIPGFAADRLVERFAGTDPVVAIQGASVLGVGLLAGDEIRTFFIDPSAHGRGIGKALLNHLEQLAWSRGVAKISLSSSVSSRAFYANNGYANLEEVVHPVGGRMFKMEKLRGS